jgi:hypothetical protein
MTEIFKETYTSGNLTFELIRRKFGKDGTVQINARPSSPDTARNPSLIREPEDFRQWGEWCAKACELLLRINKTMSDDIEINNPPQYSRSTDDLFMEGTLNKAATKISDDDLKQLFSKALKDAEMYLDTRPAPIKRRES